jgi:LmbE family N-acetylglucosaminyl deacetylase
MNILFVGAHTDDIELGCGAVLNKVLNIGIHRVKYLSFSKCTDIERNKYIGRDQTDVENYIRNKGGIVGMDDLPNRELYRHEALIRESLEWSRDNFKPSLVFTHWKQDVHQDHKVVAEESARVFKKATLLSYECPGSCLNFAPNFFVSLTEEEVADKIRLLSLYQTQKDLYYFAPSVAIAFARVRGIVIGQQYAEGFYLEHMITGGEFCVPLL